MSRDVWTPNDISNDDEDDAPENVLNKPPRVIVIIDYNFQSIKPLTVINNLVRRRYYPRVPSPVLSRLDGKMLRTKKKKF